MKIERKRYVVMRKNRTEIWGGLAQHYRFRAIEDIGDHQVKTYRTEKQALSSCSSWDRDFEVVPVIETLESTDHPTADVAPVRHGHWITRDVKGLEKEVACSVCHSKDYYSPEWYKFIRYPAYCSDCGAKMDNGEKQIEEMAKDIAQRPWEQ